MSNGETGIPISPCTGSTEFTNAFHSPLFYRPTMATAPTHVIRQTTLLHRVVVHGGLLFWERGISNEMKRVSIVSVFVRRIRFAMSFLFSFAIKLKFFLIQRQRELIESEGSSGNNLLMASDAKLWSWRRNLFFSKKFEDLLLVQAEMDKILAIQVKDK